MGEPWFRTAFGAHYRWLYAHRDQDEARRCIGLLPRLAPLRAPGATLVLDLGCGDGRHLRLLREAGETAVGLDLSLDLLRAARDEGAGAPLVRADMRRLPLAAGTCGAVLSLFTAFGYFAPEGNHGVMDEIARVLVPGGHWFVDLFASDRVRAELAGGPARRERSLGPCLVTEVRRLAEDGRRVLKDVDIRPVEGRKGAAAAVGVPADGLRYTESVAVHDLAELDEAAAASGMDRVAAAGDYDGGQLGAGPRWLLVYRRRDGAKES